MKFNKELLQNLVWDDHDDKNIELIETKLIDTSRWSTHHKMIFKVIDTNQYFSSVYSKGATECQDESPYEYEGEMIECPEVVPTEVTIIEYRAKK